MCIRLKKNKPLEEQIQNTGIVNKIVYKVAKRNVPNGRLKTPFRDATIWIGEPLVSDKKLTSYEFDNNKLFGGVTSLLGVEECLRLIAQCALNILALRSIYYGEIVILSGLIPSDTLYVEGEFEDIGYGYCSEAFLPIKEIAVFTNTIEGRAKFFDMIKNLNDWNKSLMYKN